MGDLFLAVCNRAMEAGLLVLTVLLTRLVLRKAPRYVHCLLWLLVGARLVLPAFPVSRLSLQPKAEILQAANSNVSLAIDLKIPTVAAALNPYQAVQGVNVDLGNEYANICALVWLGGVAILLLWALGSWWRLRWRVAEAVRAPDGLWESGEITSPFILGLFRPRIYVPVGLADQERAYVAAHEQSHLRRRDHWWKPLGFLLLAVYWFHPLLWLGYILLCRDIEAACDERVLRELGVEAKKPYAQALLQCSVRGRAVAVCPLAFGETGVKARVKGILNYKKPAFWVVLVSLILCGAVAVCFLTDPHRGILHPGDHGFQKHIQYGVAGREDPYGDLLAVLNTAEPIGEWADDYPLRDTGEMNHAETGSYSADLLADFDIPDLEEVIDFGTLSNNGALPGILLSYQTTDRTEVVVEYHPDGGFYKGVFPKSLFRSLRGNIEYVYDPQSEPVTAPLPSPEVEGKPEVVAGPAPKEKDGPYIGGPLLFQSPLLSSFAPSEIPYADVTEHEGMLNLLSNTAERVFLGPLAEQEVYTREEFCSLVPTLNTPPEELVPDTVVSVERRTYADEEENTFTIWELTHKSGGSWLWLGTGGETPSRLYELLDLGTILPPNASGLEACLVTFSKLRPYTAVRFEGDFASASITVDSGTITTVPPQGSEMETGAGTRDLTISPGETVYWIPATPITECALSFRIDRADGGGSSDALKLCPVSQCQSDFDAVSCTLSLNWAGTGSYRPHVNKLSFGQETGELVVAYTPAT